MKREEGIIFFSTCSTLPSTWRNVASLPLAFFLKPVGFAGRGERSEDETPARLEDEEGEDFHGPTL